MKEEATYSSSLQGNTTGTKHLQRLRLRLRGAIVPIVIVLAWELITRAGLTDTLYMPPASSIAIAFFGMIWSGELLFHLRASLMRIAMGFPIAMLVAIPLGLLFGWFQGLQRWVEPVFDFIRPLPPITLIPVVILLFGIGDKSKVALVAYACFWPIFLNSSAGVRNIDQALIRLARVVEIQGFAFFRKIILPGAMPHVVTGIRASLAVSIITLLVSEMVGATAGLGFLIVDAEQTLRIPKMFAGIVALGIVGYFFNDFLTHLERVIMKHRTLV
ncbi:MAG: ABC transporter permease [Deltaproteobacteria bacterium]|nr:ABC transporter permease [Deltaproteobacteria bacterium]